MTRRGFSLTEVLVGIVLLIGIFFSLATIFPVSLASLRKSQHLVTASNLARQALETWDQTPFDVLNGTAAPQVTQVSLDGESYTVVVTISDPPVPDPNIKQIDVQVLTQNGGDQAQVRDSTCVFNYTNPW